jgi:hypothetical protein
MSIKQNGGVFGRNPTFNDVTIDGTLTFDGDIDINSDLKIDGDLEVTGTSSLTGNVGVGVAASGIQLDVIDAGLSTQFRLSNTTSDATIKYGAILGRHYTNAEENLTGMLLTSGSSATGGTVSIGGGISDANAANHIVFYTAPNNTTLTGSEAARFNTSGNLAFVSGKGIDFSATAGTGTSELFDDYEEGTWTPTLVGSSGGSATMTLSRRTYTKIGNVVHLFMYLSAIDTTAGGFSGAIQIEGLPFSPASGSEQGVVSTACDIFTTDEQQIGISGQILSDKIVLKKGASTTNYTNSDLASTSSGSFMLHATYRA